MTPIFELSSKLFPSSDVRGCEIQRDHALRSGPILPFGNVLALSATRGSGQRSVARAAAAPNCGLGTKFHLFCFHRVVRLFFFFCRRSMLHLFISSSSQANLPDRSAIDFSYFFSNFCRRQKWFSRDWWGCMGNQKLDSPIRTLLLHYRGVNKGLHVLLSRT